jgi:hypothetical protein
MYLITDNEMDDFDGALLGAGFEVDSFSVIDLGDEPTAKGQPPITGTVTVLRISTDEFITYNAGHFSTWVSEFEADLHEGKFGSP